MSYFIEYASIDSKYFYEALNFKLQYPYSKSFYQINFSNGYFAKINLSQEQYDMIPYFSVTLYDKQETLIGTYFIMSDMQEINKISFYKNNDFYVIFISIINKHKVLGVISLPSKLLKDNKICLSEKKYTLYNNDRVYLSVKNNDIRIHYRLNNHYSNIDYIKLDKDYEDKKIVNSYQMYSCFKNIEFTYIFDIKIYILIS